MGKARGTATVSVTLERATLAKARARAALRKVSLSALVGESLLKQVVQDDAYWTAYRAWLKKRPARLNDSFLKRRELHDRPMRRRLASS